MPEEDDLLAEWQAKLGNRWSSVAKKIPGRTGQQCAQRWRHKVNPNIKKEKWTEEEDDRLLELVRVHGNAWAEISRQLDGRTDQQCMGRWRRHLDPAIKREQWAAPEDAALASLHARHGSQWSAISKSIDGRTAQQCRARWFQLETGGQELAAPRTVRRGARPKRLQYDDIDGVSDDSADLSDIAEGEEEGECEQLLGRDEDEKGVEISESDDEAPSQFSTPLKTAYSRAMSGSRASSRPNTSRRVASERKDRRRISTGRSFRPSTSHTSPAPADGLAALSAAAEAEGLQRQLSARLQDDAVHLASDAANALGGAAEGQVLFKSPDGASPLSGDVPSSARDSARLLRKASTSPLFLSPLRHSSRASEPESRIINSSQRAFDPFQRPVSGSKSPEETGSEQVTPDTTPPLDGAAADDENTRPAAQQRSCTLARTTPGGGQPGPAGGDRFRSPGAVWRRQQSPGVNLLALLQSPQQPAKSDLFLSPGLKRYNMVTPEWAKRKFAVADEEGTQRGDSMPAPPPPYREDADIPTAGRPLHRGNVARRLDEALRGHAALVAGRSPGQGPSPARARRHMLMADGGTGDGCGAGDSDLCSPAKKCKVDSPAPDAKQQSSLRAPARTCARTGSSKEVAIFPPGGTSLHSTFLQRLQDTQPAVSTDTDGGSDGISRASQLLHTSDMEDSLMQESYGHGHVDKENSTCNAFEHLAVDGEHHATTPPMSKMTSAARSAAPGDVSSTLRSSSDVRLGLMAMLDRL
ncbi:hypothetical protein WJX75_003000 [Coccomyxa subellipsoidea]|uniref:Uncharacterized protein n=1 Tax=Coccomyxa subellipsoidea TaxID=248742 RepID=A0ABR2YPI1_9CHLO